MASMLIPTVKNSREGVNCPVIFARKIIPIPPSKRIKISNASRRVPNRLVNDRILVLAVDMVVKTTIIENSLFGFEQYSD
jgi:hypothetical protein